jgi:glutaredoxin
VYQRCEKHNLAAGPDGKCALCRRSSAPTFMNIEEKPGWISRGVTVLLFLATLVAAAITYRWVQSPDDSPLNPSYLHRESALRGMGYTDFQDSADNTADTRTDVGETAEQPGTGSGAETGAVARAAVESQRPLTEKEKARRKVSVVMYGTPYCPVTEQAREYMRRMGIDFVERDIDNDAEALARRDRINPVHSTPTFEIDNEVLVGFSEQTLENALDRAAARRMKRPAAR